MKASLMVHKGENRIKVEFFYNTEIIEKIKQIDGARWSSTNRVWHIPYLQESFNQLLKIFPDIVYTAIFPEAKIEKTIQRDEIVKSNNRKSDITIEIVGRRIFLKMPKSDIDIQFVRSFHFSRWDKNGFCWVIPHYPGNLEMLKEYFKERIALVSIHPEFEVQTSNSETRTVALDDILIIKTNTGRLKIIFAYNKELSKLLSTMPFCIWNAQNKWWSLPYSENILIRISDFLKAQGKRFIFEEETIDTFKKNRITPFDIPNYRFCPKEYILKLKELRYSEKTIRNYTVMLEEFINYYHKIDMNRIDESMITEFLRFLVLERKVSTSYQNISINAIKFYYEHVLGG